LSSWRLLSGSGSFRLPEGTTILPRASAFFPFSITNLPFSSDIVLLYPDGVIATRPVPSTTVAPAQPPVLPESYIPVQAVEPITSQAENVPSHEEAVVAPAAAKDLAAAGAALSDPAPDFGADASVGSVFRSPWVLGLLSVMAVAGGAFIFL
ncbi:MAG: hypothetical protein WCT45_03435, partial [Candidatus Paceibacterota bacterium]